MRVTAQPSTTQRSLLSAVATTTTTHDIRVAAYHDLLLLQAAAVLLIPIFYSPFAIITLIQRESVVLWKCQSLVEM